MADSTVGALTAASALTGAELFYGVQAANDVKVTASQIATFAAGGGGGTTILNGSGPPADSLGALGNYYVDNPGDVMYGPKSTLSFGTPEYINATPTPPSSGGGSYRLGTVFQINVSGGQLLTARFWRISGSTATTRQIYIYDIGTTALLGTTVASTETTSASGWVELAFPSPIPVTLGQQIVICYDEPNLFANLGGGPATVVNAAHASYVQAQYGSFGGGYPPNVQANTYFVDASWQFPVGAVWPIAVSSAAIGAPVAGASAGSVLFADASGNLAQDSGLTWNATSDVLTVNGHYNIGSSIAIFTIPNVSGNNWFEGAAGNLSVTGYGNFGTGDGALGAVTSGYQNVALGNNALQFVTTGQNNLALGSNSLRNCVSNDYNIAVGYNALQAMGYAGAAGGTGNVAMGYGAMAQMFEGSGNIVVGYNAIASPSHLEQNTIIGSGAGSGLSGSSAITSNTMVGAGAAQSLTGTSSYNTWIGGYRGPSANLVATMALSDGTGNIIFDYGVCSAQTWTMSWNGFGAQTSFHMYKVQSSFVSPVNYERAIFSWHAATDVLTVGTEAGGTGVKRLVAIHGFSKAGAPAAGDVPAGSFALIDDTSGGATWLCFNKAGTIRKVQLT